MDKIRCAHCRCLFVPNHRIKNQRYCNKKECQRARKNAWQRQKLANDPDYKANQRECQKNWCARNPDYWQRWRAQHPGYEDRNRVLQKARRSCRRRHVAKMDASELNSNIMSGTYLLVPCCAGGVAKMDASAQKVFLISSA
jgi:hypothetical protein